MVWVWWTHPRKCVGVFELFVKLPPSRTVGNNIYLFIYLYIHIYLYICMLYYKISLPPWTSLILSSAHDFLFIMFQTNSSVPHLVMHFGACLSGFAQHMWMRQRSSCITLLFTLQILSVVACSASTCTYLMSTEDTCFLSLHINSRTTTIQVCTAYKLLSACSLIAIECLLSWESGKCMIKLVVILEIGENLINIRKYCWIMGIWVGDRILF